MRTLAITVLTLILGFSLMQFLVETVKSWRASEQSAGQYVRIDEGAIAVVDEPRRKVAPTAAAANAGNR